MTVINSDGKHRHSAGDSVNWGSQSAKDAHGDGLASDLTDTAASAVFDRPAIAVPDLD